MNEQEEEEEEESIQIKTTGHSSSKSHPQLQSQHTNSNANKQRSQQTQHSAVNSDSNSHHTTPHLISSVSLNNHNQHSNQQQYSSVKSTSTHLISDGSGGLTVNNNNYNNNSKKNTNKKDIFETNQYDQHDQEQDKEEQEIQFKKNLKQLGKQVISMEIGSGPNSPNSNNSKTNNNNNVLMSDDESNRLDTLDHPPSKKLLTINNSRHLITQVESPPSLLFNLNHQININNNNKLTEKLIQNQQDQDEQIEQIVKMDSSGLNKHTVTTTDLKPLTLNTDHFTSNVPSVDGMILVPSQTNNESEEAAVATENLKEVNMSSASGVDLIDNENIDDGEFLFLFHFFISLFNYLKKKAELKQHFNW